MQQPDASDPARRCFIQIWWLPVGAGGNVVVHTNRWWELWRARRACRPPEPLFHAALEVYLDEQRFLIEMTPVWGQSVKERGVVATGPVAAKLLGKLRLFRYEVRCWPDGLLPDRQYAPAPPETLSVEQSTAVALLGLTHEVPRLTWGRTVEGSAEMWNSNSLISWLLTRAGIGAAQFQPPSGYAPGWSTGISTAHSQTQQFR